MKAEYINNHVFITDYDSFDIGDILECGQCFRFEKIEDKHYTYISCGKVIEIKQDVSGKVIDFYPCTKEEFEKIWLDYFDFNRNYKDIKESLAKSDTILADAIDFAGGIRIMNQEFWDCLIAFIISQNKTIPMIKAVIKNIAKAYGTNIVGENYKFPTAEQLIHVTQEELMPCKVGFRAKYIVDAVNKRFSGGLDEKVLSKMDTESLKKKLMEIYGVGVKVADCVLIFSLGRHEVFPTDVWVKRLMQYFYFENKETPIKEIYSFAQDKWGEYAGFAQQYLFHYARVKRIGV